LKKILLWGGRSMARIVHQMILDGSAGDAEITAIFDSSIDSQTFSTEATFISDVRALVTALGGCTHFVVCIGNEYGFARFKTHEALRGAGLAPLSIISDYGIVEASAEYGAGLLAMPGSIVHKFSRLGEQCIVNSNATIDHECLIGNGVHVMGGATLAGRVTIEDFVTVGLNATILPDLSVGEGAYVGAGAVVTKDVAPLSVVVGVPAIKLRQNTLVCDTKVLDRFAALTQRPQSRAAH
jgi:sugar O-acyltransferase (sialic acid O-acetyltransferase NeuD family)